MFSYPHVLPNMVYVDYLYQNQEGGRKMIAFASPSLSQSEVTYPAHKLEFLTQLRDDLYGETFAVFIDSNPLTPVNFISYRSGIEDTQKQTRLCLV